MLINPKLYFYGLFVAGIAFIIIGIISVLYSYIPVQVDIGGIIEPDSQDILSPNMNSGNTAYILATGSLFNISISDPNKNTLDSKQNISDFTYNLTADIDGEYIITIYNIGTSEVILSGFAFTKGNDFAITGQIMLIITGIIITGLAIKTKKSS